MNSAEQAQAGPAHIQQGWRSGTAASASIAGKTVDDWRVCYGPITRLRDRRSVIFISRKNWTAIPRQTYSRATRRGGWDPRRSLRVGPRPEPQARQQLGGRTHAQAASCDYSRDACFRCVSRCAPWKGGARVKWTSHFDRAATANVKGFG